jgi:hypothetical protein
VDNLTDQYAPSGIRGSVEHSQLVEILAGVRVFLSRDFKALTLPDVSPELGHLGKQFAELVFAPANPKQVEIGGVFHGA